MKTLTLICLGATLCTAQTINISGMVIDTGGVGIPGATVMLGKADIFTTTGADGSFTLTDSVAIVTGETNRTMVTSPIQIQNAKITFTLKENTAVALSIYDLVGRQIYADKSTYSYGKHTIHRTLNTAGIYLYKVIIGNESYSFKSSPLGTFSTERSAARSGTSTLAKQAKATEIISDVISVVKEGQLNYRDSIKVFDTCGIIIEMIPNAGNVTDIDGNVYQSVRIGNQVWTVENLRTTKYNDNTPIANVTDNTAWNSLATGAYCYYANNAANKVKYGALYNGYAVNTGKLAPEGWRVPTDAEWDTLQNYLIVNGYNWDGTTNENKMAKSMAAQTDWSRFAVAGSIGNDLSKNNASGFSAYPGGWRSYVGSFDYQSNYGFWWSVPNAWVRTLGYMREYMNRSNDGKNYGCSVRLLRDLK